MKTIRIAAAALNQTPLDWGGNAQRIREAAQEAANNGAQILCLPELCITGYGCEDMFLSPHVHEKAIESLHALKDVGSFGMITLVGLPVAFGNGVYNCMAVIQNGGIRGFVPKQNLAQDGVHYEPRWFKPWPQERVEQVYVRDHGKAPIGDLVFKTSNGVKFGFEICEDAWIADRPGSRLSHRGVDIIFSPSASHFAFGKQEVRRRFVTEGSRAFSSAYVYANLLGNESGRIIFDGATMIASGGEVVAEGERFSFKDYAVTCADVDLDTLHMQRYSREGFRPEDEIGHNVVEIGGVKSNAYQNKKVEVSAPTNLNKFEEFEKAVTLGLFDYMRKTHTHGYVISLSGGADSSAAAVLVHRMYANVVEELSDEELQGKVGYIDSFAPKDLLTCVYQATKHSSDTTVEAAEKVAEAIQCKYLHLDVDPMVEAYEKTVGEALGLDWDWDKHDVARQNIQARTRSPSVWMISNIEHKILLATSNRSEAAVGYATMDGDTSGGLSPLAGIDKAFLLDWLVHMQNERGYFALKYVNQQQPTAELKPVEFNQTDEGDLMPYDVLDRIEELAIGDKKSPSEVFDWLTYHTAYDAELLVTWIERFFQLWCRNQWKRERYAPSFHLDDKNLDPKTWCRFPILSSGYKEELAELRKRLPKELL